MARIPFRLGVIQKLTLGFFLLMLMLFAAAGIWISEVVQQGSRARGELASWREATLAVRGVHQRLMDAHLRALPLVEGFSQRVDAAEWSGIATGVVASIDSASRLLSQPPYKLPTDSLRASWAEYQRLMEESLTLMGPPELRGYRDIIRQFDRLEASSLALLQACENGITEASTRLANAPWSALGPAAVVLLVALLFAGMFIYLAHRLYIRPLRHLSYALEQYVRYGRTIPLSGYGAQDEVARVCELAGQLIETADALRTKGRPQ